MKKILSLAICCLIFVSVALAVPHPKYKKDRNARLTTGKVLPPKPPMTKK